MNAGGAQKRAVAIANGLVGSGLDVEFVAVAGDGTVGSQLKPEVKRVQLTDRPRPWYRHRLLNGLRQLEDYLKHSRPDVLLAAITNVHLIATLAAKRTGLKSKLMLRASRHPVRQIAWSRPVKHLSEIARRRLDRWLYDQAEIVVAVSEDVGRALRKQMADPARCVTLPNPVVSERFVESLQAKPDHPWLDGDVPVIISVGRLVWQKGFDRLLDAFARVADYRVVRLIILGEGKLRRQLEHRADALGISDCVDMPGQVAQVGPWMAHANLLVSSSNFEGSPGVLIEALAAGCPVVATDCPGGSAELLRDRKAGILVPMGSDQALADAINDALDRKWDRHKLRTIAEPFREKQAVRKYSEVLPLSGGERRTARG
jgi:glycosyltransferase involved in cell wall biosynthesis